MRFSLSVLLLNKELQFEWGKRERAEGRVVEWNKRTCRRISVLLSLSVDCGEVIYFRQGFLLYLYWQSSVALSALCFRKEEAGREHSNTNPNPRVLTWKLLHKVSVHSVSSVHWFVTRSWKIWAPGWLCAGNIKSIIYHPTHALGLLPSC